MGTRCCCSARGVLAHRVRRFRHAGRGEQFDTGPVIDDVVIRTLVIDHVAHHLVFAGSVRDAQVIAAAYIKAARG